MNLYEKYSNQQVSKGLVTCNMLTPLHHPPFNDSHSITIMLMWSPLDHIRDREHLFWSDPSISGFSSHGGQFNVMRGESC